MANATRLDDKAEIKTDKKNVRLISGSPNVFINGKPAGRYGDLYEEYLSESGEKRKAVITIGSPRVFINGRPAARIGDSVSYGGVIIEGSSNVFIGDGGGLSHRLSCGYEVLQKILISPMHNLSKTDEIILFSPLIAENMSRIQEEVHEKLGWKYLSNLLRFWLTGKSYVTNKSDRLKGITAIYDFDGDWEWFRKFSRFNLMYQKLCETALSDAGKQALIEVLKKTSAWENGGIFDFSTSDKDVWEANFFNHVSVPRSNAMLDSMDACLGSFTICAVASGKIEIMNEGYRKITITGLYAYVRDIFNFNDSDDYRYWSKEEMLFKLNTTQDSYYHLTNTEFNTFRDKYNKGEDFLILSDLHKCDEFQTQIFFAK